MIYLFLFIIFLAILLLPQFIVQTTLKRHNQTRTDIPGSGGEFALHLIHKLNLSETVRVEPAQVDHYNPMDKMVGLSADFFNQHSLAAMVIAAHEIGHAVQDAENNHWMRLRDKLVSTAHVIEKIAPLTLAIAPVLLFITKSPALSVLMFFIGFLAVAMTTLLHLITLPVELDASFNKAMPILQAGNYLPLPSDAAKAKAILRAAAFTYVAQSLFNLLNIAYWLRLLAR